MSEFKHVKNNYLRYVKEMPLDVLQKELDESKRELMRAGSIVARKQNPYKEAKINVKRIRWIRAQILSEVARRKNVNE